MAQHSTLRNPLLLLALGATSLLAQGTRAPGDYVGVLFPNPAGNDWSATVGRLSYTPQAFPGRALITNPGDLSKFVGSQDEMGRLLRRGVVYNSDGTERILDNAIVDFSRRDPRGRPNVNRDMLVGMHLGSQGSRDYTIVIEKIEVKREDQGRAVVGSGGGDGGASRLAVLRDQLRNATERLADLKTLGNDGSATTNQLLEAQGEVERLEEAVNAASAGVSSANRQAARRVPNAFLEISYRISSRRSSATVADPEGGGLRQQLHAPAHLVRIPHVPIDPRKTRWLDVSRPPVFPASLDAISLIVKDSGSEESIGLRVNSQNRVNFVDEKGKAHGALLSEMIALGNAIKKAQPSRFVGRSVPVRSDGGNSGLNDNGTFELAVWNAGERRARRAAGKWNAVREDLNPLYTALHAIHLRIKEGISADEQERLAGRLGLDTLFFNVQNTASLPGVSVRIDKVGKVLVDGDKKGRLTEREWDLLGTALDYVNVMELPDSFPTRTDSPTGLPDVANPRRFKIEATREGTKKITGGEFYGGAFQENDKIQVLKAVLDLIASRVARRSAEVAGVVGVQGEVVTLTRPLGEGTLTVTVNPVESDVNGEALRLKLKEWSGRWVEVRSIARITDDGAQMIVRNVLYPQLAELTGVFTGTALAYQAAGDRATGGSVNLAGQRMAALLAGQNNRWVKIRAYLFYNQNLLAETAFVEAIQAVLSRRVDRGFLERRKSAADESLIHLFSTPDGTGAPAGTLSVGPDNARPVWVTNRVGEFVYLPDYRAWARVKPELLHLSENPDNIDEDGPRRGGLQILRDALRGMGGN